MLSSEEEGESEDSADSSSSDDHSPRIINNAGRRADAKSDRAPGKRRCLENESAEETSETAHTVLAVYGKGEEGDPEVWLGVKVQYRGAAGKVKLQFLALVVDDYANDDEAEAAPAIYELRDGYAVYNPDMIEHAFTGVAFISTTTFKLTKGGRRSKSRGKHVVQNISTRLKQPLDAGVLADLARQCAEKSS